MIMAFALMLQSAVSPVDSVLIAEVRAQAEREPVEAIGKSPGLVTVRSIQLADVDGDGYPEAFVAIERKYRETPTVLVYSFNAHGLRRLREALVPGRLVPVSGTYASTHEEREALDMGLATGDPANLGGVVSIAVEQGMAVVRYRTFLHADFRHGFVSVVDLSYAPLPSPNTGTCSSFEFESVEATAAGTLSGDAKRRYFVALTPTTITVYRIDGISQEGYLEKRVWLIPRPSRVSGLEATAWGEVQLRLSDGTSAPLSVQ